MPAGRSPSRHQTHSGCAAQKGHGGLPWQATARTCTCRPRGCSRPCLALDCLCPLAKQMLATQWAHTPVPRVCGAAVGPFTHVPFVHASHQPSSSCSRSPAHSTQQEHICNHLVGSPTCHQNPIAVKAGERTQHPCPVPLHTAQAPAPPGHSGAAGGAPASAWRPITCADAAPMDAAAVCCTCSSY